VIEKEMLINIFYQARGRATLIPRASYFASFSHFCRERNSTRCCGRGRSAPLHFVVDIV